MAKIRLKRRRRLAPGDPKKAVAYLRVSTDEQAKGGLGLDAQREAISQWAKREGIEIVSWHSEDVSRKVFIRDRASFPELMDALRQHRAGVLVAYRRDRWGGDDGLSALYVAHEARALGAVVRQADGNGNGDDEASRFNQHLDDYSSGREIRVGSVRTREGLAQKKARGERVSPKPPYGWRFVKGKGKTKRGEPIMKLVENEREQKVIRRIRRLAGKHSTHEIARRLNKDGVPARGERWHATTIWRILKTGEER